MFNKIKKWWLFHVKNRVVRQGESGGFKWVFRRFTLDITTVSENFKARFTAGIHPYGYLISGKDDDNIKGFCATIYEVGTLLTSDKDFAKDIQDAIRKYSKKIQASATVVEDREEEQIAIETEKAIQEHIELPTKERRKVERDINGRFKKAVKDA